MLQEGSRGKGGGAAAAADGGEVGGGGCCAGVAAAFVHNSFLRGPCSVLAPACWLPPPPPPFHAHPLGPPLLH